MRMIRKLRDRLRREDGNALMEFSMLGITVLIPLLWIILIVFEIQRAMYGVSAAAREATRAFTLQEDVASAQESARLAATLAMEDQGLEGFAVPDVTCGNGNGDISASYCLQPGSTAHIDIEYNVELPFVPEMFDIDLNIPVSSQHTTPFGQYRSGDPA